VDLLPRQPDDGIQFIDEVLSRLPFTTECVQTDNGAGFQGAFHWRLLERDIQHV
jgi:hypothetical protein